MFVAGGVALVQAEEVPQVSPEIVSAWKMNGGQAILIFRYDGYYYQIENSSSRPGMEYGSYEWNKGSGSIECSPLVDTNGEFGLSHPAGATSLSVSGNTLTYAVVGEGSYTFSRVVNAAGSIVGSWFMPGDSRTITFLSDNTFYFSDQDAGEPSERDGMQYGTYSWNPTTHVLTTAVARKTVEGGLNFGAPATVVVTGNKMALTTDGETENYRRLDSNSTPVALPQVEIAKEGNFWQSSATQSSLTGYTGWALISDDITVTSPTVKIGAAAAQVMGMEGDGYEYFRDYGTLSQLNSGFPDGAGNPYVITSSSSTVTLTFPAGGTLPPVPLVKEIEEDDGGGWQAGFYRLDHGGDLAWSGHTNYIQGTTLTSLEIEDSVTGEMVVDQLFQGDVESYRLKDKLVPGHRYSVSIELVKLGNSTTSGSGVFSGRQGHSLYITDIELEIEGAAIEDDGPVVFSVPPQSRQVSLGDNVILSAGIEGSADGTCEWLRNGAVIPGQTGNSLALFGFTANDYGSYSLRITDSHGTVTSAPAVLSGSAAVVEEIVVEKDMEHVQTGPSTVILNPRPVSPNYGGAYGFSAIVAGQHLLSISAPTVTPPAGAAPGFYGTLFYNDFEDEEDPVYVYGPNANNWGATSQAEIDSRFPNGVYTFNVGGTPVSLNLSGNAYPNIPQVTLTGGNWINGKYAVDGTGPVTAITNSFSGYGTHADDYIAIDANDVTVEAFASSSPGTNSLQLIIPANTLPVNETSSVDVEFAAIVDKKTVLGGAKAYAVYGRSLEVEIHILPKIVSQSASQTLAAGGNITLQISATGSPVSDSQAMAYQWKKAGVAISGANTASLVLTNFQASNAGSYTCTVTNDVGTVTSAPIGLSLTNAFEDSMTASSLNPASTGAPGFDYDGDGLPNLLEFVLGGDPKAGSTAILPKVKAPGPIADDKVSVTYRRKISAAGISQVIEHSTTLLQSWTPAIHGQGGVSISVAPVDASTEEVTVTLPPAGARYFVRLKATK